MNLVVLLAAIRKVYKVIPEEKTWKGYPKGNLVFYEESRYKTSSSNLVFLKDPNLVNSLTKFKEKLVQSGLIQVHNYLISTEFINQYNRGRFSPGLPAEDSHSGYFLLCTL